MATTNKSLSLMELIKKYLNIAPESTLEKVLELLEDNEDIRDALAEIADAKINGTIGIIFDL